MKALLQSERDAVDWSGGREREERSRRSPRSAREATGCAGERSQESSSHRGASLPRVDCESSVEATTEIDFQRRNSETHNRSLDTCLLDFDTAELLAQESSLC